MSSDHENDIVRVHPSKKNLLSHKVLPISNSLLTITYDFGSLTEEIESQYISNILQNIFKNSKQVISKNNFSKNNLFYRRDRMRKKNLTNSKFDVETAFQILLRVTSTCQIFIKRYRNNESSVSLRDIDRVQKIFVFYALWIRFRKLFLQNPILKFIDTLKNERFSIFFFESMNDFLRCLTVTIFMSYINRIGSKCIYLFIHYFFLIKNIHSFFLIFTK